MKVYTIKNGVVEVGAKIEKKTLHGCDVEISCIAVGESGRGRKEDFVCVDSLAYETRRETQKVEVKIKKKLIGTNGITGERTYGDSYEYWPMSPANSKENKEARKLLEKKGVDNWDNAEIWEGETEYIYDPRLYICSLGETRTGKKKITKDNGKDIDQVLVVFQTSIGFRGSNRHLGDCKGYFCSRCKEFADNRYCSENMHHKCGWNFDKQYEKFPGQIIARGIIAQGAAGHAGSGEQIIAIVPKNSIFIVQYTGRLYGSPNEHHYKIDENCEIIGGITEEERYNADVF